MAIPDFTLDELATEEWRSVFGDDWMCKVSNLGRVQGARGHVLTPETNAKGYYRVTVRSRAKGKRRLRVSVHSLVANAFIGERPENCEINHKDRIRINNRASNLEYLTHLENMRYSGPPNKRLTADQVREIKTSVRAGISTKLIAEKFSLHRRHVNKIMRGETWTHIE